MSLNGLDTDEIAAAHDAAVTEPAGWFLLQYVSRDEVSLLASGDNGFVEAREAIAKYEESSPLFGLVVFKKKKALLKFVPEDTSRLLQARLSVHVQSVIEKFPHDALISLTTADDLTESELSSALTKLKSSGSIRSNASKKQRHLTEIPEDTVEVIPKSSPPRKEQENTTEAIVGPESPPDPLLSPASEPFSPARLENSSLPYTTPEVEKGSFVATASPLSVPDISSDKELSEPNSSPEVHARPPGLLSRSSTYELEDPLTYKPKVKLGPRPSLDYDKRRPSRGSSYRPVVALPAGLKISTRSTPESERPSTAKSTSKPGLDDMSRVAAFSVPIEPPTSRPGSVVSVSSPASGAELESPIPSTTPTITPEKLRLMKALEKRKRYQQSKQTATGKEEPSKEEKSSSVINGNSQNLKPEINGIGSTVTVAATATATATSAKTTAPQQLAEDPQLQSAEPRGFVPSESSAVEEENQNASSPKVTNEPPTSAQSVDVEDDTSKEVVEANDLESAGSQKPVASPFVLKADSAKDEGVRPQSTGNRESIQDGIYLARSESPSSGSEAADDLGEAGPGEAAGTERAPISHPPIQATKQTDTLPAELSSNRSDKGTEVVAKGEDGHLTPTMPLDTPTTKEKPSNLPQMPEDTKDKALPIDNSADDDGNEADGTFLQLGSAPATPATGLEGATSYVDFNKATTVATSQETQPPEKSSAAQTFPGPSDSIPAPKSFGIRHQHSDSASTVKPPPLPEGPTQTIVSNIRITTDDGTKEVNPPASLSTETKPSLTTVFADPKRLSAATTDTKRSSADSKSSKRRPPPFPPSKHDSSDLASLDGDLLYEELQSAKLEEATSMVVARSPATTFFQDPPRSLAREADFEATRSPVTPVGVPDSSESMRPKLVHTTSPPVLSRFSSDQSTNTIQPKSTATTEAPDSSKGRSFSLVNNVAPQASPTTSTGNSSPGRKGSGVSSLISQRIRAIEGAKANGSSSPTDRTSVIAAQIVSQRKASLTTPPGSAGTGSPPTNRLYQNSATASNEFVARTFGSVRVSSSHANRTVNGTLERQSSRESASGLSQSASSSRLSSLNTSPNERGTQKPKTSYFSVEPTEKPKKSQSFSSSASTPGSTKSGPRLSISSKKSNSSQKSSNTERQRSPGRSESSMSSDGDGEKKRNSRGSRILRRISGLASSPRRNIAEALTDQSIAEGAEPRGGASKRTSTGKAPSPALGNRWMARDLGDVNIQFPDNLLWKRRHMEVDASGNVVLAPASTDTKSKVQSKRYHISQFTTPYTPDQDREELPHSIILDLQDSSTLQCSCENAREQAMVLQVLRSAHATFLSK